jgi:hypothetical protein
MRNISNSYQKKELRKLADIPSVGAPRAYNGLTLRQRAPTRATAAPGHGETDRSHSYALDWGPCHCWPYIRTAVPLGYHWGSGGLPAATFGDVLAPAYVGGFAPTD